MGNILKKQAINAKQRISSGLWNNPESECYTINEKIYLNTRRKALSGLNDILFKGNKEKFFEEVYSIVSSEYTIFDPIKRLCEVKVYSSLSIEEKQRYVLNLSKAYVFIKQVYEEEVNIKNL